MLGAITGDIIGSVYEHTPIKTKDFPFFAPGSRCTDDSVLTVAIAAALLNSIPYRDSVRDYGRRYPQAGYGASFVNWLQGEDQAPYNSWGNGSAMRVSPVAYAFENEEEVLAEARKTAEITHNHPEGVKGAQATALAVFLARTGSAKEAIRHTVQHRFGYNLEDTVAAIRPSYRFDISCQGTVPAALISFFDASSFEDAVRNSISLGGDSDTLACIAGSIAEAYYGGVPADLAHRVRAYLPAELWQVVERFGRAFPLPPHHP